MNTLDMPEAPDGLTWRLSKTTYYDGSGELMRVKLGRPQKVIRKVGLVNKKTVETEVFVTVMPDGYAIIKSLLQDATLEERIIKEAQRMLGDYNDKKRQAKDSALSELLCGDY